MPPIFSPTPISDFDLAVLRDRGVSRETAWRNKIRTEAEAMVIPFADRDGKYDGYEVRRPHRPTPGRDGKLRKYINPVGLPTQLYTPSETRKLLKTDPTRPVLVTEGPLKTLALAQRGYATVGVAGVWNWKVAGTDDLTPGLAEIDWKGRTCYVVFDYDAKPVTQHNVAMAAKGLSVALRKAGAESVVVLRLPPGPGGAKNGVDDYLVANGDEAFAELVRAAGEPTRGVDAMDLKSEELPDVPESLLVLGRPGYVIKGLSNLLSGSPKAGKTSLLYQSIPACLAGGDEVLYLSEEPSDVWQHRLKTVDVIDRRGLILVFGLGMEPGELLDRVRRGSESVVVADTLRGLGILGEDENDNSAVARSLTPWLKACRDGGKTFVGIHHDRKSGGTHGRGVSGAHALVGAVDVVMQLRVGGKADERVLTALSRLAQPNDLSYTRSADGTLSTTDVVIDPLPADVLARLPSEPPGWTMDEVMGEYHVSKVVALFELNESIRTGRVKQTGAGVKGNPKRYYRPT
jgi:hypothetical protein